MIKKLLLMVALVSSLFADAKPHIEFSDKVGGALAAGEVMILMDDVEYRGYLGEDNVWYGDYRHDKDWIGVYKHGATNSWENVLQWTWFDKALRRGDMFERKFINIANLPAGEYDIRYFKNNSFITHASFTTTVKKDIVPANLKISDFVSGHYIDFVATYQGQKSWIGIYKKGASNSWNNVKAWRWVTGAGALEVYEPWREEIDIKNLPAGEYEARLFYNNSYKMEAKADFTVEGAPVVTPEISYAAQRDSGFIFETTTSGEGNKDWVGLYKIGDSNSWDNVITWEWVDVKPDGFGKSLSIHGVATGEYELRLFYHNSFKVEAVKNVHIESFH